MQSKPKKYGFWLPWVTAHQITLTKNLTGELASLGSVDVLGLSGHKSEPIEVEEPLPYWSSSGSPLNLPEWLTTTRNLPSHPGRSRPLSAYCCHKSWPSTTSPRASRPSPSTPASSNPHCILHPPCNYICPGPWKVKKIKLPVGMEAANTLCVHDMFLKTQ